MKNTTETLKGLGYVEGSPVFSAVMDALVSVSAHDLTPSEKDTVLDLISSTGQKEIHSLPNERDYTWVEFDYGNVKPGNYVRVLDDAYDSITGVQHNGRMGVLLNLSGRRATVRYIGINSSASLRHPIDKLQSLRYSVQ